MIHKKSAGKSFLNKNLRYKNISHKNSSNNNLSNKNLNNKNSNFAQDKMDPIMKAVKAVHSIMTTSGKITADELARQRQGHELFSKLVTPPIGVAYEKIIIDNRAKSITNNKIENRTDNKIGNELETKSLNAEWATPDFTHDNKKVILYCHGGGYTCGGLNYARILAGKLALHVGIKVLFFEYRLAPENPYPAAIEDGMLAYDYLMYLGYGAENVIIAGDSAGGNMALEIALQLKKDKRLMPKALVLMSPWTDMTATSISYEQYKDLDPILTKEYIVEVRNLYAGSETDYSLPQYSPLFADLSNMPPMLIQVGSNEILRNDSEALYKKLIQNDCYAKIAIHNGAWHVFQQLPFPKAAKALDEVRDFIWQIY